MTWRELKESIDQYLRDVDRDDDVQVGYFDLSGFPVETAPPTELAISIESGRLEVC